MCSNEPRSFVRSFVRHTHSAGRRRRAIGCEADSAASDWLSVVGEGEPAGPLVPHPAAVPLHPRVGGHLDLHLLFLFLFVHLGGETGQGGGSLVQALSDGQSEGRLRIMLYISEGGAKH